VSPWLLWFGIPTPDQSLVPNLPAAVAFCVAFAFGWLVQRQIGLLKTIERQWPMHLASAAVLTGASLAIVGPAPEFTLATQSWTTTVYAVLYAAGGWSWALALLGAALRFFAGPSAFRRYVSDASYWIYLAHLPLVFGLQAAMKDLPWHWSVKFPLLLSAALALLFGSYHTLVRFTFVGEVLNGRRYRRGQLELTATADAADAAADAAGAERQVELPLARLTAATKRFGKTLALDGLDLDVRRGEVLALLGPNGAGKSTAISLLLGLLEPDTGTARLFGQPPGNVEARYQVGVMMQEVGLAPEMRVRELLDLTTRYYPAPMSVDEALALTQTTGLANLPYGKLSAGQKRQAQFALAVCGRPALLFLDEPTVGLDVQARETLWAAIRLLLAQGVSMVLTTHYLEEAEALATRVAVLSKGRLIAMGTVDDMRALVARKRVSCISTLPAEDVGAWTGVSAARRDGDRLHIVASEADQVVRRLLAADTSLRDLEVQKAGLAEAFAEITQEAA
jgi:ABC-type multidrug transport system ATPase subunit